jgi:hypothetical protein
MEVAVFADELLVGKNAILNKTIRTRSKIRATPKIIPLFRGKISLT